MLRRLVPTKALKCAHSVPWLRQVGATACTRLSHPATAATASSFINHPTGSARRFCSTSSSGGGIVLGDPNLGIRDSTECVYRRSEFIGRLFPLVRPRTDAGEVLSLIDICAGRAALYHGHGYPTGGRISPINGISMATVSFNSFMFPEAVFEGDLILIEGRVIHVGKSSIGVYLNVKRQGYDCPLPADVGECYVTMVTIDANNLGKVRTGICPALRIADPQDLERYKMYHQIRKDNMMEVKRRMDVKMRTLNLADVEVEENKTKKLMLTPKETVVNGDRCFGVHDVNTNNVIFGGEILRFMERTALHCGRVFARKARLFTLGMMGMTFDSPIYLEDLVRCSAHVCCVRRSSMLVEVRIEAEREGKLQATNKASFLLVAVDEKGTSFEITTGIDLSNATQKELQSYWNGRYIMESTRKNRHLSVVTRKKGKASN